MHEIQLSKYKLQFYKNNNHLYKGEIEICKECENIFQKYEIHFSLNIFIWKTDIYWQDVIKIQSTRETRCNHLCDLLVTSLIDNTPRTVYNTCQHIRPVMFLSVSFVDLTTNKSSFVFVQEVKYSKM